MNLNSVTNCWTDCFLLHWLLFSHDELHKTFKWFDYSILRLGWALHDKDSLRGILYTAEPIRQIWNHTNPNKPNRAVCVCAPSSLLSADRLCSAAFCHTHWPSLSSLKPHTQPSSSAHWKGFGSLTLSFFLSVTCSPSFRDTCRFLKQNTGSSFNRWAQLCGWKSTNEHNYTHLLQLSSADTCRYCC